MGLLTTQTYVEKHARGGDSVDLHIPPDQEAQAFPNQNGKPASPRRQENQPVTGELLTGWLPTVRPWGSVAPNEIFDRAVCRPRSDWPGPEPFRMPKPGVAVDPPGRYHCMVVQPREMISVSGDAKRCQTESWPWTRKIQPRN